MGKHKLTQEDHNEISNLKCTNSFIILINILLNFPATLPYHIITQNGTLVRSLS